MNKYGKLHVKSGLIGAVIVLAFGGTGVFAINKNRDVQNANLAQAQDDSKMATTKGEQIENELLTIDEFKKMNTVVEAGSTVAGVELEEEHGAWLYKVKLANGKELFFDARSGKSTNKNSSRHGDDHSRSEPVVQDESTSEAAKSITSSQAAQIAKEHNGGGAVRKIEHESEHGAAIYSVRFYDDARVDVRASDGVIVRVEPGDADKVSDMDKKGDKGRSKDD